MEIIIRPPCITRRLNMYGLSGFRYIHKVVQPSLVSDSRTFASPEKKPGTRAQSSLLLPTPKLLSVTHLLSVSLDLLTLTTSCKRNPMVIPFCVRRLSLSVTFSGFVHVPLCLSIPFLALIIVHRADVHFLRAFISSYICGWFALWGYSE